MEANDTNVFTEHVKTLSRDTTEIPSAVRQKLTSSLKQLLRKRGLLKCSAGTFGYSGRLLGDAEPFDELLNDAYNHLFYGVGNAAGEQLDFLKRQVHAENEEIDRLIQRNLSNFVHDLHRNAFPSGAGIHKNVVAAAKELAEDPENEIGFVGGDLRDVDSHSVLGIAESGSSPVEIATIERAIRELVAWADVLKIIQRFSKAATIGTANGTLALIQAGKHPILLLNLERAIAKLAYEPAENALMTSDVVFSDEDAKIPEFVRTICDEDRYQERQAKVDDLVHEGRLAIANLACDQSTKETLIEILHCFAEKSRHCDSKKNISQAEVAREIGLPKQTMSDYMKKLRAALELIQP